MSNVLDRLRIVSADQLAEMLPEKEREALEHHQTTFEVAMKNGSVKYFDNQDALTHAIDNVVPNADKEPLDPLLSSAVKSALLGYWLHGEDFTEAKSFRDQRIIPLLDEPLQHDWNIKLRQDHTIKSRMNFFIAKSALGTFCDDIVIKERRTFAAFGEDGSAVREIDIKHALGVSERHPFDQRTVVIAPTSTSIYAYKVAS